MTDQQGQQLLAKWTAVHEILLPRCVGCDRPMPLAQNARYAVIGWLCMSCYEAGHEQSIAVVRPLPRLRWWRRALARLRMRRLPEARLLERPAVHDP
jgi:hypothetical protein